MPKKTIRIANFTDGLNTDIDPKLISDESCVLLKNFSTENIGKLKPMSLREIQTITNNKPYDENFYVYSFWSDYNLSKVQQESFIKCFQTSDTEISLYDGVTTKTLTVDSNIYRYHYDSGILHVYSIKKTNSFSGDYVASRYNIFYQNVDFFPEEYFIEDPNTIYQNINDWIIQKIETDFISKAYAKLTCDSGQIQFDLDYETEPLPNTKDSIKVDINDGLSYSESNYISPLFPESGNVFVVAEINYSSSQIEYISIDPANSNEDALFFLSDKINETIGLSVTCFHDDVDDSLKFISREPGSIYNGLLTLTLDDGNGNPDSKRETQFQMSGGEASVPENVITKGNYMFGFTFINEDKSESKIHEVSDKFELQKSNEFIVNVKIDKSLVSNDIYGFNLYVKKDDEDFGRIFHIDYREGYKLYSNEKYVKSEEEIKTDYLEYEFNLKQSNLSYDISSGIAEKDSLIKDYKKFISFNRYGMCFAVKVNEKYHNDRIIVSAFDKITTFPETNNIDIVTEDGDVIVDAIKFSSKLLIFKKRNLYIINVSSNDPSTFFLERSLFGYGVTDENKIVETEAGIFILNEYGIHVYNGEEIRNLVLNKIEENFKNNFYTSESKIGYNAIEKRVIIVSNQIELLSYNLKTNSFSNFYFYPTDFDLISNIYNVQDIPTFIGKNPNGGNPIYEKISLIENDTPSSNTIISKDYDLGIPSVRKKVRRFYINFVNSVENSDIGNISFSYSIDGNEFVQIDNDKKSIVNDPGNKNIVLFDLERSITFYHISFKIELNINFNKTISSVSIIYRPKLPK